MSISEVTGSGYSGEIGAGRTYNTRNNFDWPQAEGRWQTGGAEKNQKSFMQSLKRIGSLVGQGLAGFGLVVLSLVFPLIPVLGLMIGPVADKMATKHPGSKILTTIANASRVIIYIPMIGTQALIHAFRGKERTIAEEYKKMT